MIFGERHNPLNEYIDADPTKYSKLPLDTNNCSILTFGKVFDIIQKERQYLINEGESPNKVFKEKGTKFEFVELDHGEKEQKLITLILKGILPVADIVSIATNRYVSSVLNLNNLKKNGTFKKINADNYLLNLLFLDTDHDYGPEPGSELNMCNNKDYSKYYIFDFGVNCFYNKNYKTLKKRADNETKYLIEVLEYCFVDNDKGLEFDEEHFLQNIDTLKEKFIVNGVEGYKLFMILIKESGLNKRIGRRYWKIFKFNLIHLEGRFTQLQKVKFN